MKFKSHGNLIKHLKTSRHQLNKAHDGKPWAIDTEAMKEQSSFAFLSIKKQQKTVDWKYFLRSISESRSIY